MEGTVAGAMTGGLSSTLRTVLVLPASPASRTAGFTPPPTATAVTPGAITCLSSVRLLKSKVTLPLAHSMCFCVCTFCATVTTTEVFPLGSCRKCCCCCCCRRRLPSAGSM